MKIGYKGLVTYVAHCDGFLKVGRTEDIDRRIRQLQLSCPLEVRLLSFVIGDDEAEAHKLLKAEGTTRVVGEWYEDTPRARDTLISIGILSKEFQVDGD